MAKVVGVKFKDAGKLYYFSPAKIDVKMGDNVIVETARGLEFGKIVMDVTEVKDSEIVSPLKNIIRIATEKDQKRHRDNLAEEGPCHEALSGKDRCTSPGDETDRCGIYV